METAVGEGLATGLTDNVSFATIFWLLAGLNVINVPILWGLFRLAPDVRERETAVLPAVE